MATFAEKCVLAVLGYTALTNYQGLVADSFQIQHEQRSLRGSRTEGLILRWQALLPNAEVAAQFYRTEDASPHRRGARRKPDARQTQFFEEQLFNTVNFWRVAGADIALSRVNAGELSTYLARDARTWLTILRGQAGRWDDLRNAQINGAIRSLEIILNIDVSVRSSEWEELEICNHTIADCRDCGTEATIELVNPNNTRSPSAPIVIVALLTGAVVLIHWPTLPTIPARGRISVPITVPHHSDETEFEVRFAHPHEY